MAEIKGTEKQVITAGMHRPVCVKCMVELRPETNGVGLLDVVRGAPYALWDTDKWRCPICGYEVIGGFACAPVSAHYNENFEAMIKAYMEEGKLVELWHS